ncbi:hypothetical protein [Microbacterium sp. NPDC055683]
MNDDELVLHDPARRGPVPTQTIRMAARIVDQSGVVEMLARWEEEDRVYRGGRTPVLSSRAILILWMVTALELEPMLLRSVEAILRHRLTPKTAEELGVRLDPSAGVTAHYERARSATQRILRLVDAFPLPDRRRALTKDEYEEVLAARERDADRLNVRARRNMHFNNALLEATLQMLPSTFHDDTMSVVIDATRFRLHSRGVGKGRLARMQGHETVSSEPDAGFYVRDAKHRPIPDDKRGSRSPKIVEYALEAEFAVWTTNDPSKPSAVPNIVVSYAQHRPGALVGESARAMVDSLAERGHHLDHLVADRAYLPGAKEEVLQIPMRRRGVKLVMDYPKSALGVQENANGAILVDGSWYSPALPPKLRERGKAIRDRIDAIDADDVTDEKKASRRRAPLQEWRDLAAARAPYLLRAKERMDERGKTPMMCPAAGPNPTMTCPLKPLLDARKKSRALMPVVYPPSHPGTICTNKSSAAFTAEDGGKYEQYYQYRSPEWEAHYNHARSQVESYNDFVKDPATFALAEGRRRRMRGYTAQSLLVVLTLVAANMKKIRDFLHARAEDALDREQGLEPPKAKTRRTRRTAPDVRVAARTRKRAPSRT